MSREACASSEVNVCPPLPSSAVASSPSACAQPGGCAAGRRIARTGILLALGLFFVAAALAQNITVSNNVFSSTAVGATASQTVSVTLHAAVALKSISIPSEFTEFSVGTITGCTVDGSTVNASGTVCSVPVTFRPAAPGSSASPSTARTAPLQVTDIESSNPVTYSLGLLGSATGPVVMLSPTTLSRVAGAAATGYPAGDQGFGQTTAGFGGDSGPATSATFGFTNAFNIYAEPTEPMAIDSAGNLYVYDQGANVIRRIDGSTNTVTTIAGTAKSAAGESGDGSAATSATIGTVNSLVLDAGDNLYFLNQGSGSNPGSVIRRVDAGTGVITAIAGQSFATSEEGGANCPDSQANWLSFCGDGGPASQALFYGAVAMAMDSSGNIYVLNGLGNVRRIDASTGNVSEVLTATAIGTSTNNYTPLGFAMGADGNLYIAELDSTLDAYVIRQFNVTTSGLTVVMGGQGNQPNATTCTQQGSMATSWYYAPNTAEFQSGLSADGAGNIYGSTAYCSGGSSALESASAFGIFRLNISTGLAYAITDVYQEGSGQGGNNSVFDSWLGLYQIAPTFAVADSAGNVYFQTFNQIAKINGATGVMDGFTSRDDYATDAPGTGCSNLAAEISTSFCQESPIANVGNAPLEVSSIGLSDTADFTFLTNGDSSACSASDSVPAGQFCDIDVEFTPTTAGAITGNVTISDNAPQGSGTQEIALTGSGIAEPEAALAPLSPAFTSVAENGQATETFTLSNPGTGTLDVYSTTIVNASSPVFTASNNCGGSVAAGGSCVVTVTFNAPSNANTFTATLDVSESASANSGTLTEAISASSSAAAPSDTLGATSLNFYGQIVNTTSGVEALQISNPAVSGASNVNFTSITATAPFAVASGGTNACSTATALQPDEVCYVYVTFSPTAAKSYTGTLTISSNDSASPQTVSLSGQGVIFTSSESAPGTSATMNVYITGTTGTGELVHTYVLTQGNANEGFYQTDTNGSCAAGTTYTPPQTCTVDVTLSAQAPGSVAGAIVLTDASGNILGEVNLSGTGTGPLFAWQPGQQVPASGPVSPGYSAPLSVATDVNGDFFVSDSANNRVVFFNGSDSTVTTLPAASPALSNPFGVAVDGLGNVFVADTGNARVVEWLRNPESNSFGSTPVYIESSFSEPAGVAVDNNGNLYVADAGNNKVWQVPVQVGGAYGTAVSLGFSGLHFPKGVAVDASFNVYVADTGDGNIDLLPWTGSGFGTASTVVNGLTQPIGVAVDASGSVYTSSAYGGVVYIVPFNGTAYGSLTPLSTTGLLSSTGIALDNYGDLYIADPTNNDVQILYVDNPPTLNFTTTSIGLTSIDSPRNVWAYNVGNQPLNIVAAGGTPNPDYPVDFPENTKQSGLCAGNSNVNPGTGCYFSVNFTPLNSGVLSEDVAVDDNNYGTANEDDISVNGQATGVEEAVTLSPTSLDFGGVQIFTTSFPLAVSVTANSGSVSLAGTSITQTGDTVFALATGANACTTATTLAAGQSCVFYVTYAPQVNQTPSSGTLNIGSTGEKVDLSGIGIYFNTTVGNSLSGQDVSVDITTAGTLANISVLTNGVSGLDYTNVSGGTCSTSTAYTVGQVCTVDVGFAPQYSGSRLGAVMLTDSSGKLLGMTYLNGEGNAPQIAWYPVTSTQGGFTSGVAAGIAVDGKDDVFYVDSSDNLQELPPSATTPTLVAGLSTLLSSTTPENMVMDPAGNIFIAGAGTILEVPSTGSGTWGAPADVASAAGLGNVTGVAVDGLGNLYAIVPAADKAYKIPYTNGVYGPPAALGFAKSYVYDAITTDSAGDVYLLVQNDSTGATQVLGLTINNTGNYGSPQTILSTVGAISGGSAIAIDNNGNLFVSGLTVSTNGAIDFIPSAGSPIELDTGFFNSLAVDAADNIFAIQSQTGAIFSPAEITRIPMAAPPTLAFKTTAVGSTSSDSPKTATLFNIGNQSLYFNNVQYPTDYPENSGDSNLCNAEFPVSPGGTCDVSADFTPTVSGTLNEDATLTDDALNGDGVQQLVPMTGIATGSGGGITASLTGINFGNVAQGKQSATMAATLTNNSTTAALNITSIGVSGTYKSDFTFTSGSGTNCSVSTPVPAGGSCQIYMYFIPSTSGNTTETVTLSVADNATNSPQTSNVTGNGTGSPAATLSAASWNFGGVQIHTVSVPLALTVTNTGTGELNITGESIAQSGSAFQIVTGNNQCTTNALSNGANCVIYVTYSPTVAGAVSTGTLSIGGVSQTVSLTGTGVSFVEPVLGASTPQLVAVNISTAGTLAAINVETIGSSDYEFGAELSGNTCTSGTAYTVGQLCQVNIFFTPGYPGDIPGAILLSDANGNILGETWITGTGQGSQIDFYSPKTASTTVASSLSGPYGVAVDTAGNVYIAESNGSNVIEVPVSQSGSQGGNVPFGGRLPANRKGSALPGVTYGTPISLGGGIWDNPSGVALDGAGDLFVADPGNGNVWELPWNGSLQSFNNPVSVYNPGESSSVPVSVAADNYGNLYIGVDNPGVPDETPGTATILELPQTNFGGFGAPITVANNLDTGWDQSSALPFGLAVDSQGNVYAGVFGSSSVEEFSPTGPGTWNSGTVLSLTGLQAVTGLAIDANNDLYLADPLNNQVVAWFNQKTQVSLFSQSAVSLALDEAGDVFAGLSTIPSPGQTDSVVEYPYSQPLPLDFANTAIGVVSSDSPKGETVVNIGNENLTFSAVTYPADFPESSGDTSDCSTSTTVDPGLTCDVSANFKPTVSGTLNEDVTLTDNAKTLSSLKPQQIPVSGTATGQAAPTATLTGIAFGNQTEGVASAAMAATLTNTSSSASLSITGVTIIGTNKADFAMATGFGACGTTLAAGKSCSIYVIFTPSTTAAESATLSVADNATGAPQTAALTGTGTAPPAPAVTLSPTSLAFGSEEVNTTSAAKTVTVTNSGTGTLTINSIYLSEPSQQEDSANGRRLPLATGGSGHPAQLTITASPDYAATTTCGSTLAAGANCTVSVTFTPGTTGSLPGTLGLEDNATNSPQTVSLSGTGVTAGQFTVASPTPPQTVRPGGAAQYTINVAVTPTGDIFPNQVTLSATGLPGGATASFTPAQVVPGTGMVSSTMSVQTSTQVALLAPLTRGSRWPVIPSGFALACCGAWAGFRRKHRERLARYFALVLLLVAMGAATFGLMGCGAGFAQFQPKTYTITVTGTSGESSASTTVQLTVE